MLIFNESKPPEAVASNAEGRLERSITGASNALLKKSAALMLHCIDLDDIREADTTLGRCGVIPRKVTSLQ
jgi:hypothetical protein